MAPKLLRFAPADFPQRPESPFNLHQNPYKNCSTSKIQDREATPNSPHAAPFSYIAFFLSFFRLHIVFVGIKLIEFLDDNLTFITKTLKYCLPIDPAMPFLYI